MKEIGKMTCKMDMAKKTGSMEATTKDIISSERSMGLVNTDGKMEALIQVNELITLSMVVVFMSETMAEDMKETD